VGHSKISGKMIFNRFFLNFGCIEEIYVIKIILTFSSINAITMTQFFTLIK